MHNMRHLSLFLIMFLVSSGIFAQNDLMDLLKDSTANEIN